MKHTAITILLAAALMASCDTTPKTANAQTANQETEKALPYQVRQTHRGDSARITAWLKEGSALKSSENLVMFYARKFIGYPYVAYTLDQDLEEGLVINTQGVDCTTYVENVLALTACAKKHQTTFADFCRMLATVRYVKNDVAYISRQHYFTLWLTDNIRDGLVADIQLPPAPLSATRTAHVDYMSTHVSSYKMLNAHPKWLPAIKELEQQVNRTKFTYIPKAQLKDSDKYRKYVRDGDIIAIVTDKAGLDISHVGFASWHKDGLHLLNASSLRKKVVDEPMTLYQYLQKQTKSVGIRVARIL